MKFSLFFSLLFALTSCKYLSNKDDKEYFAKCGDEFLYKAEVYATLPKALTGKDSSQRIKNYVDNWVRKKLIEKELFEDHDFESEEIERKIQELKYQLALHEYKTKYLNEKLDTVVKASELKTYYNNHKDDFQLRSKIVKALFAKFPVDAPHKEDIPKMISSKDHQALEEFKAYCYQFANRYYLNDSVWISFKEITDATPFETSISNEIQFLRKKKLETVSDSSFSYFLLVKDYKLDQEISPFDFVKSGIKSIIINKRKTKLIKGLEETIYSEAIKNKSFEIYY